MNGMETKPPLSSRTVMLCGWRRDDAHRTARGTAALTLPIEPRM
jgi:hypothetical protein